MIDAKNKNWIDNASYEMLLRRNRFSSSDDEIFHGECGKYYISEMNKKKKEIGDLNAVLVSKKVGWD